MGGLSRKRTQSRIVKKSRPKSVKRICKTQVPTLLKDKWDQKKSLNENYAALGLKLNLKPNLRHSEEGKRLILNENKKDRKRMLIERA